MVGEEWSKWNIFPRNGANSPLRCPFGPPPFARPYAKSGQSQKRFSDRRSRGHGRADRTRRLVTFCN